MDTSKFDWPAILRASGIVIAIAAAYAFIVPVAGALAMESWDTLIVSGHEIYRWLFWGLAWGLVVWQGNWMLNAVHDRVIDDMLVVGAVTALALLVVKVVVWFVFWPTNGAGERLLFITPLDVAGALMTFVAAFIAARANQF